MATTRSRSPATSKRRKPVTATRPTKAARARSRAAVKEWETRRANAKKAERAARASAKKRSDSARKGWETRRAKNEVPTSRKRRLRRPPTVETRKRRSKHQNRARPSPAIAEFAVSADYKARKRGSSIGVQIALRAPRDSSKAELEAAVAYAINHKGEAPAGFEIAIVDWKGNDYAGGPFRNAGPADNPAQPWTTLGGPLALADLKISPIRKDEI